MSKITTAGTLFINEALPKELHQDSYQLDKAGIEKLMTTIQQKYQDQYKDIVQKLYLFGGYAALSSGHTISLSDTLKPVETKLLIKQLKASIDKIINNPKLDDDTKEGLITGLTMASSEPIKNSIVNHGLATNNPLAIQAKSGSRGNNNQYRQIVAGDGLVSDHHDKVIGVPILSGYSEGLDPVEYFAASYGARKGSVSTKFCLKHDTQVRMADGTSKAISSIKVGDVVLGSDSQAIVGPVRVTRTYSNGKREINKYTFRNGSGSKTVSVEATPQHNILFHNKSLLNSFNLLPLELCSHKEMYCHLPLGSNYLNKDTIYMPYLIGHIVGAGTVKPHSIEFKTDLRKSQLLEVLLKYLHRYGFSLKEDHYGYAITSKEEEALASFFSYCDTLGLQGSIPTLPRFPKDLWNWSDNDLIAFLTGYIEAKGGFDLYQYFIFFDSRNLEVLTTIHDLLNYRLGLMTGSIMTKECGHGELLIDKDQSYTHYHLRIHTKNTLQKLYDLVQLQGIPGSKFDIIISHNGYWNKPNTLKSSTVVLAGFEDTYDIEVDSSDHLFVLSNGLIVSNSTQEAGFYGKQLAQATHRVVVTEEDCGASQGIPVVANDPDNVGALLALPVSNYKANTPLTPTILKDLGNKPIYIRSSITCQASHGICAKCAGIRETGKLPQIGDNIGLPSAQALGEKMAQGMLSAKHGGGQVTSDKKSGPEKSGFNYMNQLIQAPTNFAGAATLTDEDGHVQNIEPAEQGGSYVTVNNKKYYVPSDQDVTVKLNDSVEKGDTLSNGTPNPAEVAMHKGIGEGRLYFMNALYNGAKESGIGQNRRNIEVIAKSMINHVKITDPDGYNGFLPDDIVSYDDIKRDYEPREGFEEIAPDRAANKYLESNALHYSIGTRITPRVIKSLKDNNVNKIVVHNDPPPFEPHVVRAMENSMRDPNWMTRLGGSYLQKGFTEAVHRGRTANLHDTSFIPSLAKSTEFGKDLDTKGTY